MTLLDSGVDSFTGIHPFLLVIAAAGLDRLVGDPRWCLHPVVVMGWGINRLRQLAESWAQDSPRRLRFAGVLITLLLVGGSAGAGWLLEQISQRLPWSVGLPLLLIALASALAGRSLEQAVQAVLRALPPAEAAEASADLSADLSAARTALSWIVGRDTSELSRSEILRAAAETASENAVDGLFAPLFWMLMGAALWSAGVLQGPGPLALAWGFKAASTLDSMLGYRRGRLEWLGTAGARLDDLLVWLPCRLVALSLPLVQRASAARSLQLMGLALKDGRPDPSPNAGVSQAIYAHCLGVQLGGVNRYGSGEKRKPLLAEGGAPVKSASVLTMLQLSQRLELLWLIAASSVGAAVHR